MFTGIIEETGVIRTWKSAPKGAELVVSAAKVLADMKIGDSIAVNGVCLTVTSCSGKNFTCDVSSESIARTSFAKLGPGAMVNLERPLAVGSRMGGHFVLGHVDGMGTLISAARSGEGSMMIFGFPSELERYLVYKGSIAVDGISLTLASLESDSFTVAVIPQTLKTTTLGRLKPGDPVNLEVDVLGKYIERFFRLGSTDGKNPTLTMEYLKDQGF